VVILGKFEWQSHCLELVGFENLSKKATIILEDLWDQDDNIP